MTSLPRALAPLRHPSYRWLAASLAISLLGQGLWAVAVVWQVVALDGGPAALSLVTALAAGGMLASTLLGGALADRLPQRHILLAVELTQAASIAVVAGLSLTGRAGHRAPRRGLARGRARRWGCTTRPTRRSSPSCCPRVTCSPRTGSRAWSGRSSLRPRARRQRVSWWPRSRPARRWRRPPGGTARGRLRGDAAGATPERGARRRRVRRAAGRRPRGIPVHGADAVAAGHPAVRVDDAPGLHRALRGAGALRRSRRPAAARTQHAYVLAAFGLGGAVGSLVVASLRLPRRYLTVMNLCGGWAASRWWCSASPRGCG